MAAVLPGCRQQRHVHDVLCLDEVFYREEGGLVEDVDCRSAEVSVRPLADSGFGAFLAPAKYPLSQRGVRIVYGKNLDYVGTNSNGAWETKLVMASLGALTGTTDASPDSIRGLPLAEVVHSAAKHAHVQVDGIINGKPFLVEKTTVFQGQYGGGGLLEALDKEFKEELNKFMGVEVSMVAKERSAQDLCGNETEVEQLEGALEQLGKQYKQLQRKG